MIKYNRSQDSWSGSETKMEKEWDYGNRNESEKTGKGAQAG